MNKNHSNPPELSKSKEKRVTKFKFKDIWIFRLHRALEYLFYTLFVKNENVLKMG